MVLVVVSHASPFVIERLVSNLILVRGLCSYIPHTINFYDDFSNSELVGDCEGLRIRYLDSSTRFLNWLNLRESECIRVRCIIRDDHIGL